MLIPVGMTPVLAETMLAEEMMPVLEGMTQVEGTMPVVGMMLAEETKVVAVMTVAGVMTGVIGNRSN